MKEFIVKVQRPLATTEDYPAYLVYGHTPRYPKYRTRLLYYLSRDIRTILHRAPKAYFRAAWSAELDNWVIGKQVPAQNW